jgi:hypothetical protein
VTDRDIEPDDIGYTLWALADDWTAEHGDEATVDPDDVYDWLIVQGRKLGAK